MQRLLCASTLLLLALGPVVRATTFAQPTSNYVQGSQLLSFADPDEAMLSVILDGYQTVRFSTPMRASTVGDNWASWGLPPNTESATPRVLWSGLDDNFNPITAVT